MQKINLKIDGKSVSGFSKQTVLQVARENGIEIPTFCYDERLKIYGSCGLCMVEIKGSPKLFKACATEISEGMVVETGTERVIESRKTNLELLLSKHIGDCIAPCQRNCPGSTDCQGYVGLIALGEYEEALKLIKEQLPLPGSIGRVCPHPCETACRRAEVDEAVSILDLKRFVADYDLEQGMFMPQVKAPSGKSIGIIGGGPGGLSAAYYLVQSGHEVTIYDAMPKMGGMLRYGIPEYRLPKNIVDEEVGLIERMGVKFENNTRIGEDISLDFLRKKHHALYIAIGAWTSSGLRCDGTDAKGVIGGIELLRQVTNNEPFKIGKKVAVVGGGNTAMDACRTAVRLGAKEVYNIYRRTKAEMPAEEIEIIEAEEEGVIFKNLTNPLEIVKDSQGAVSQIRLQKMELGEPDESGRRRPVAIEGQEELIDVDTVVLAIGQGIDANGFEDLELTKWHTIIADEHCFTTNLDGVFAGGDCINDGASIAIKAIGDAKKAVKYIEGYLLGQQIEFKKPFVVTKEGLDADDLEKIKKYKRPVMAHLSPEARKQNFTEIVHGYTEKQAQEEANRCLECGCQDYFECKLVDYANQYQVNPADYAGKNEKVAIQDDHPFVIRDNNKCITCGLCVRVCEELAGVSAIGLVDRGFETSVEPALRKSLSETGCVSCGLCISVCPTGALIEGSQGAKAVPLQTNKTVTTCGYCSAGCQIAVESIGNTLIKGGQIADQMNQDEGILCGRGRFGINQIQKGKRLTMPLVRNQEGQLIEASWYEALVMVAKRAQSIGALYGEDAVKIGISPKYTNEEISELKKLANVFRAETFSFSNRDNQKTKSFEVLEADSIEEADTVFIVGLLPQNNPIIHHKVMQASRNGATIIVINHESTLYGSWGQEYVVKDTGLDFLAAINQQIIENGLLYESKQLSELTASLKDLEVNDNAREIALALGKASKLITVVGDQLLTSEARSLIENIHYLLDKTDGLENGIISVVAKNNSRGLINTGIVESSAVLKDTKALLLFGEDPACGLTGYDFLLVQDTHLTDAAMQADVVLPATSFLETNGSFTNMKGQKLPVNKVVDSPLKLNNIEIYRTIAEIMGVDAKGLKVKRDGEDAELEQRKNFIPQIYRGGKLFEEIPCTDYLMNTIQEELNHVTKF